MAQNSHALAVLLGQSPAAMVARLQASVAPKALPAQPARWPLSAPADWLRRRQGPHPFNAYMEPLHFNAERLASVPRAFIDAVSPAYPTIATARARAPTRR